MHHSLAHIQAEIRVVAISQEERAFFVALGARIAQLRKNANSTQVRLAEFLGVSQQTVNAYAMGHRRMAIAALPRLTRLLGVSIEELFGEPARSGKRGPTPQPQQKIERLSRLPQSQQKMLLHMLDGMLSQAGH